MDYILSKNTLAHQHLVSVLHPQKKDLAADYQLKSYISNKDFIINIFTVSKVINLATEWLPNCKNCKFSLVVDALWTSRNLLMLHDKKSHTSMHLEQCPLLIRLFVSDSPSPYQF